MSLSFSAPVFEYDDIAAEIANKMTQEEQEAARDDLYGERIPIAENEDMIESALQELKERIEAIDAKEAYETAQVLCPEYVNSRDFCLMFLRCERFDTTKAAKKIVTYWEQKVDVWGEDKAFRRLNIGDFDDEDQIALSLGGIKFRRLNIGDFDDEDQIALTMGGIKFLPEQDNAGRGIIFSHRDLYDHRRTHHNSMVRLSWYIVEAALEDVNIQRNGIVCIACNNMASYIPFNNDTKLVKKLLKIGRVALPLRFVGIHRIIASEVQKMVLEQITYWFGLEWRARLKHHSGIKTEYLESLAEYGIQRNILPQVLGGDLEFDYEQWLDNRRTHGR